MKAQITLFLGCFAFLTIFLTPSLSFDSKSSGPFLLSVFEMSEVEDGVDSCSLLVPERFEMVLPEWAFFSILSIKIVLPPYVFFREVDARGPPMSV